MNHFKTEQLSEAPIAFIIHNLTLFEIIEPLLKISPVKYDIYIPKFTDALWNQMSVDTFQFIKSKGYRVLFLDDIPDLVYKVIVSGSYYSDSSIMPKGFYNVRLLYSLAKESWNFDTWNVFYDLIFCYGAYDSSYLSAYTRTVQIGPIRFSDFTKKVNSGNKKKVLYMPTYGDACSIEQLSPIIEKISGGGVEFYIRLHHGTYYLETARYELVKKIGNLVNLETPLKDLMANVDLVVSDGSGAIFDAIATSTPIVVYQPVAPEYFEGKPSLEQQIILENLVTVIHDPSELEQKIYDVLSDDTAIKKQELLRSKLFSVSGDEGINIFWKSIMPYLQSEILEENGNYLRAHSRLKRYIIGLTEKSTNQRVEFEEYQSNINDIHEKHKETIKNLSDQLEESRIQNKLFVQEFTEKSEKLKLLEKSRDDQQRRITDLQELYNEEKINNRKLNEIIHEVTNQNSYYSELEQNFINQLEEESLKYRRLEENLNTIHQSNLWKVGLVYYKLRDKSRLHYLLKAIKVLKLHGFKGLLLRIQLKLRRKRNISINADAHSTYLNTILKANSKKQIIIFPPIVDWHIPLYQRPQHIAKHLANKNYLYFYCTNNDRYDNISGFEQVASSQFVTNRYDLLSKLPGKKIFHLYSTDLRTPVSFISEALENGNVILYEYIDEIHEDITGPVSAEVYLRHKEILKNEACLVIVTADKLYNEVMSYRSKNVELVTNGVQYEHFHNRKDLEEIPDHIKRIQKLGKPIIGYFGALAKWFDYELIEKLAIERPDYQILLIGPTYDESLSDREHMKKMDNITFVGPVDYFNLPKYARWFNVSIIPFVINEITESTSPIKLFEYMALGHPIVTTAMPECRKYQSVLIGENQENFIEMIDVALSKEKDMEYLKIMDAEAKGNAWDSKANVISNLIQKNL
ncbi:glycosyltransferase [Paenibacillus planticolens]|uniref:Glycosyltransferase n=1 Tax=Paenibacillus planticolens TaxID=2654976 RepID=A0ABX1ZJV5_9BACL|nr:glycosyltransferase [Paenibacillus planticolens]NOV00276.1 glycosyltransferase [Paenibacillus planticolens]